MKLYSYFRSSAAYRVRIVLNLKNIDCEIVPINLLKGEQKSDEYAQINSQQLLPALELDDGRVITQSLAICEWLDVNHPVPRLIPGDNYEAAKVRALALSIASDIHPINNLRILKYLESELSVTAEAKNQWYRHWVKEGLAAIEASLSADQYCFGKELTLADVCLVPQVYNAVRFDVHMSQYPKIAAIDNACNQNQAFIDAHPDNQLDSPATEAM
ncbi:MAG: maleylacetoacetate isomerase [Pseudomonadales bacterium]